MRQKPKIIWEPYPGAQKKFLTCPVWECLLHGNRGGGKQVPDFTKVLTKRGFKRIDQLEIGDLVYSSDGNLYPVTGIFPQGVKTIYKMTLQDGRVTLSGDEHLWKVVDARMKERVISTIDMYNSGLSIGEKGRRQYKFRIPNCKAVHFQKQTLPIDPYILGCLISEGTLTTRTPKIATTQQYILDRIKKLYPDFEIKPDKSTICNYTIVDKNKKGSEFPCVPKPFLYSGSKNRFINTIEFLGLNVKCHDKFIPKRYKFSSINQRMELLQGLIDTDGHVGKNGHSEFTSASERLIKDVAWVCRSLGIRCRIEKDERIDRKIVIRGKEYTSGLVYRLYINTSQIISQKQENIERLQNKVKSNQEKYISIIDIEKLSEKTSMTCISVDSPDHTYLIENFIVTHNTDVLIMDYLQGVGRGYGADYKGLLLREATTELGDVISKCRKWIPRIFPTARYNGSKKIWTFADGETLWLNYARTLEDYFQYHGHEYPWIGWEELTNHALPTVYLKIMSCNRSSNKNITPKYRATCNPSGPGHQWVKSRFIDAVPVGKILREELEFEVPDENGDMKQVVMSVARTHVQSFQSENKSLSEADPLYMAKIFSLTQDDPMLKKAWIDGSWDLIIGGFFTDVWDKKVHKLNHFIPPRGWRLGRSFDWGSSKPWCVTYALEANGEQPEHYDGPFIPKGSVIICNEIYGWNGTANEGDRATSQEIAERVKEVDNALLMEYGIRCTPGPADTSIWEVRDGTSIAANLATNRCFWTKAYKGSGSRIAGWALIRQMLGAAKRKDLENPHLYFFDQAAHHIRTLPIMQRDPKKPEDIDCFVAGTLVSTSIGQIPIEDIKEGDFVCTPVGERRVIKAGVSGIAKTFKVELSNDFVLQGTPDHKIFVEGIGLVPLCKLKKGNEVCQRFLHFTEGLSSQVETDHILSVIHQIVNFLTELHYCTEQNGKIILDQFLTVLKFITETSIDLIHVLEIFNVFMARITQDCICKKECKKVGIYTKNLKNGEILQKAKSNLEKILQNVMKILPRDNVRALIVVNLLLQNIQQKNSVHLNAGMQYQEKFKRDVLFAEQYFGQSQITKKKHRLVVTNVVGNCGEETVYNLTTEQAHLYYANGCLVSNTDLEDHAMDSLRYFLARKMMEMKHGKVGM